MSTENSVFMEYNSFVYWQIPNYHQDLPDLSNDESKHSKSLLETMDKVIKFVSDYNIASMTNYTFHFVGIRDENNKKQTQIFDNLSAVSLSTNLNLDSPLKLLHELIRQEFTINNTAEILLLYSNSILVDDILTNSLKLQDCGITDNSCFLLALHDDNYNHEDEKKKTNKNDTDDLDDLGDLKQLVWTKSIERAISLDVITLENDMNVFRMPYCNHSMTKQSLYDYILSEFKDKKENIRCPHTKSKDKKSKDLCGQMWDYPTLKQYLLVNDENEYKQYMKYVELEILSARNMAQNNFKLQRCSQCKTLYYREKNMDLSIDEKDIILHFRSDCILCKNIFCFGCGEKWDNKHFCDESFRLQTLNILATCSEKDIDECDDVPEVRACPQCGQLIHHIEDCKHMKCNQCKTSFCFVCLTVRGDDGEWPCGEYDEECDVHQRQTNQTLPKLTQKNIFQLF